MRPPLAILALNAAVLSAAVVATPVFAASADDEVISTAQAKSSVQALTATAPPPPVVETPVRQLTTQEQIDAFLAPGKAADARQRGLLPPNHEFDAYGPSAYAQDDRDADGKRKIHGEMSVSVGTGGYRSASASALIPVGESTTVGIAVSKTDFGRNGAWAYGDGYGYGGAYGYGGYPTRLRGGERQSMALSVMSGNAGRRSSGVPDGCAPGFRDGGRYVEPLWVDGLRDDAHPCSAADR
jgi:hypothetical protein